LALFSDGQLYDGLELDIQNIAGSLSQFPMMIRHFVNYNCLPFLAKKILKLKKDAK